MVTRKPKKVIWLDNKDDRQPLLPSFARDLLFSAWNRENTHTWTLFLSTSSFFYRKQLVRPSPTM